MRVGVLCERYCYTTDATTGATALLPVRCVNEEQTSIFRARKDFGAELHKEPLSSTMPATMRGTPSATRILANPTTTPPKTIVRRDPFHLDDPQVSAPPMGQLLLRTLGRGARR